jgi:hypothetical protein
VAVAASSQVILTQTMGAYVMAEIVTSNSYVEGVKASGNEA